MKYFKLKLKNNNNKILLKKIVPMWSRTCAIRAVVKLKHEDYC